MKLETLMEADLGQEIGQLRAAPVALGEGRGILLAYGADFDVDPYVEMFFFPTDTLKLAVADLQGRVVWRRDLGPAVVPGVWFCPVLPFDLDGDGVDEIWYVANTDASHPLGLSSYVLQRLDGRTGEPTGQWPWPHKRPNQDLSHTFRNFLIGGHVSGEPVLVTAQGTYEDMFLQGYNAGMAPRWERHIRAGEPGARGSHMCAIADLDEDGRQELLWGERCIELDTGEERFCADRDSYRGHSDVAQPVLDRESGRWYLYTCREGDGNVAPRVAAFDAEGTRVWGDLDKGHIDTGWVAHLGESGPPTAMAMRIGSKTIGPEGRFDTGVEEFVYNALTGERRELGFSAYRTIPVDLNGDGRHELVRGLPGGGGELLDSSGRPVGTVAASVAAASKLADAPGEQLLTYTKEGIVRLWADANAEDSPAAERRYELPIYAANQRLTAVGYNLTNLGGF